jgi:hypothetical protein
MAGFSLVLLTQEASVDCALGKESNRSLLLQQNFKLQFKGPSASSGFATFSNGRRKIEMNLIPG